MRAQDQAIRRLAGIALVVLACTSLSAWTLQVLTPSAPPAAVPAPAKQPAAAATAQRWLAQLLQGADARHQARPQQLGQRALAVAAAPAKVTPERAAQLARHLLEARRFELWADRIRDAGLQALAGARLQSAQVRVLSTLKGRASNSTAVTAPDASTHLILGNDALPLQRELLAAPPLPAVVPVQPSYQQTPAPAPQPTDLVDSADAPLHPEIVSKAAELGYEYTRILDFVRGAILTEWYPGAQRGALGCLRARAGNDVDQASLLIALLRASNVPARYVRGIVRVPLSEFESNLNLQGSSDVLRALNRTLRPHQPVVRGGVVDAIELDLTWVSAYLPFVNYRGSAATQAGRVWLPLAPAIKPHQSRSAAGVLTLANIGADVLVQDFLQGDPGISPLEALRAQVQQFLTANPAAGDYEGQLAQVRLAAADLDLLPASLPFDVVAVHGEQAGLPTELAASARISVRSAGFELLAYDVSLVDAAVSRLIVSFQPATADDQNLLNRLGGGLAEVPPYLVQLRPRLSLGGRILVVGSAVAAAADVRVRVELHVAGETRAVEQTLVAGGMAGILLDAGVPRPAEQPGDAILGDSEAPVSRVLGNLAARYAQECRQDSAELADLLGVRLLQPLPTVVLTLTQMDVERVDGVPLRLAFDSVAIDAAARGVDALSRGNHVADEASWFALAALQCSWREHRVFEEQWAVPALSADRALARAAQAGMPVLLLQGPASLAQVAGLSHPDTVKAAIGAWLQRGHQVRVPASPLDVGPWRGSAWQVLAADGSAGYFLSGGIAGGVTLIPPSQWYLPDLAAMFIDPYAAAPNRDPSDVLAIRLFDDSDQQIGDVDTELPVPLRARVEDPNGRPVVGASVHFDVVRGGGSLRADGVSANRITLTSNARGLAEVYLRLGSRNQSGLYISEDPGDPDLHPQFMGTNSVRVSADSRHSASGIAAGNDYSAFGRPGGASQIELSGPPRYLHPDGTVLVQLVPGVGYATWSLIARDAFDNVVANAPITLTTQFSPIFRGVPPEHQCSPASYAGALSGGAFLPGACPVGESLLTGHDCLRSTLQFPTRAGENIFHVAPHNVVGAELNLTVSTPGAPDQLQILRNLGTFLVGTPFNNCRAFRSDLDVIIAHAVVHHNGAAHTAGEGHLVSPPNIDDPGYILTRDDTIEAARPGEWLPVPRQFRLFSEDHNNIPSTNLLTTWTARLPGPFGSDINPQMVMNASPGAEISNAVWLGGGLFEYNVRMPPQPGRVTLGARMQTFDGSLYIDFEFPAVWSVLPQVVGMQPASIPLSAVGTVESDIQVSLGLQPPEYISSYALHQIERSGDVISSRLQSRMRGPDTLVLGRGWTYDVAHNYAYKFSINEGTPYRIESNRFPLTSQDDVIVGVGVHSGPPASLSNGEATALALRGTQSVMLTRSISVSSGRGCDRSGELVFLLARRARVRVDYYPMDQHGNVSPILAGTLFDNLWFDAGTHRYTVGTDLPIGRYQLRVAAVAENGAAEELNASLEHRLDRRDHLGLGHTVIADVDLFDGQITVGRQDMALAGRGPAVELQRTWRSLQGDRLGILGRGWASNLAGELQLTACNPRVIGAQGAGTEFEAEGSEPDGSLRYRALDGFHGVMYQRTDGSYDVYAKDGTRYHFVGSQSYLHPVEGRRTIPLSFTEDSNGNRVTRTYQWLAGLPVLTELRGSGGRTLSFDYEIKPTGTSGGEPAAHPLLVRARGPEQFELLFEYDDKAQLIRTHRTDVPDEETYAYQDFGWASGSDQTLHRLGSRLLSARDEITARLRQSLTYDLQWVHSPRAGGAIDIHPELRVLHHDNALQQRTSFQYLGLRGLGLPINTAVTSPRAVATDYRMNRFGGVDRVVDPIGTTLTEWNLTHRQPSRVEDREGTITQFDYDEFGNLLVEGRSGRGAPLQRRYTWKAPGDFAIPIKNRPASHIDFAADGELYQYDDRGNRVARTRAGETETWTYSAQGDVASWTDFGGALTTYAYSERGLPLRTVYADSALVQQGYDARGRLIERIDEIGRVERHRYDGLDRPTRTEYADGTARRTEYLDAADTRIEYDELNRPATHLQDALGRTVRVTNALSDHREMAYDAHGNLVRERKFDGTETTHEYDALDRRIRTIEPLARITERDHDGVGNLLEERAALGPEVRTTRYQYQHAGYARTRVARLLDTRELEMIEVRDGEGRLIGITDPLGHVTEIDLDGFGREIERREPLGRTTHRNLDAMGRLTSELVLFPGQAALTRAWTFDARGRETSASDRAGGEITRAYDAAGQMLQTTDPTGRVTGFTYDARGRVASETRPGDGRVRTVAYDAVGNVLTETRPSQSPITHTYDDLNRRLLSVDGLGTLEELSYDPEGRILTRKDPIGAQTRYVYDELGRQTSEQRPLARAWTRTWTAHGELARETNPRLFVTTHGYDSLGRRISSGDPIGIQLWTYDDVGNPIRHEDRLRRATVSEYDALNRRTRQIDPAPLASERSWRFDALDRVIAEVDRNGVETTLTLDGEGRERQRSRAGRNELQEYDAAGRRISRTDAQGRTISFIYDPAGRLKEERRPLDAVLRYDYGPADELLSSTDADGITTTHEYDLRLRKLSDTNPLGERTLFEWDPRGLRSAIVKPESEDHRWEFDHDAAGRLERVTDPLGHETEYAYDSSDNLIAVANARGEATEHDYDALNRRTQTRHPGAVQETYTLDAEGNRSVWVRENGQRLEMDYDALNRLVETRRLPAAADGIERVARIYDAAGNLTRVDEFPASGAPRVWTASYDEFNRRIESTDRNGITVRQRFDASDNRIERTGPEGRTQYAFNALDQLQAVTPPDSTATAATVSAAGRLQALDHGNGTRTELTRDSAGRIRQMRHLLGAAAMLTLGYTLDANGNRTAEVWTRDAEQVEIAYELDLAERLTAVTTSGQRIQYTLDEHGNRTIETAAGLIRSHHYDARDQLTETRENDQVVASYGYDEAGRQTSHTANGITRQYQYDTQDRLLAVTQDGVPLVRYESDAFGQRTLRDAGGQVEQYQWDGTRLAGRTNATGSTLGDYQHAYGWAISSREAAIRSTLHTDVHGTPQLITDGTAAIAGWTRTDVWGVEKASTGQQSRLGHTGYLKDPLLGDELYAQARQYRAGVGRFTSVDPWEGDNNSPLSLNKYLYGYGNPGSYTDPSGNCGGNSNAEQALGLYECYGQTAERLGVGLGTREGLDAVGQSEAEIAQAQLSALTVAGGGGLAVRSAFGLAKVAFQAWRAGGLEYAAYSTYGMQASVAETVGGVAAVATGAELPLTPISVAVQESKIATKVIGEVLESQSGKLSTVVESGLGQLELRNEGLVRQEALALRRLGDRTRTGTSRELDEAISDRYFEPKIPDSNGRLRYPDGTFAEDGASRAAKAVERSQKPLNRNRRDTQESTILYRIDVDGEGRKVGISSLPRTSSGNFTRPLTQVQELETAYGNSAQVEYRVRREFPDRALALDYEKTFLERFKRLYGQYPGEGLPGGNKTNR